MKLMPKAYVYLIAGVMVMSNVYGCSDIKYAKYSSKDKALNISLDYIADWKFSESRGSYASYAQVMFFPLGQKNKGSRPVMAVTVKEGSKMGIAPIAVDAAVDDLLAKRMQFKDARVLSKSKMQVLDTQAAVIELSYQTLENLIKANSKLIPVKEKIIIFQNNGSFYFLNYQNSAEDFDNFKQAFSHLVATLQLKGK